MSEGLKPSNSPIKDQVKPNQTTKPNKKMAKKANAVAVEFPIVVKGKTQWVDKKDYASKRADQLTKQLKENFTAQQVTSLLDAAIKDKELDETASDAAQEAFELVKTDYETHQEHTDELRAEIEEAAAAEKAEREAQASKELALVERGTKDIDPSEGFKEFFNVFDVGSNFTQCVPKDDDVTDEQLIGALSFSFGLSDLSQWAVGDLINLLEARGLENVVNQVCEKINRSYQTASKWARTAKAFAPGTRDNRVSFTNYAEIGTAVLSLDAKKDAKEKLALVKKTVEGGLKAAEVRGLVNDVQAKNGLKPEKPEKPEGGNAANDGAPRYLVMDIEDIEGSAYTTDDINEIDNDTQIVIDLSTLAFGSQQGKALKWTEIPFKASAPAETEEVEVEDEDEAAE